MVILKRPVCSPAPVARFRADAVPPNAARGCTPEYPRRAVPRRSPADCAAPQRIRAGSYRPGADRAPGRRAREMRNARQFGADRQFTIPNARLKLKRLCLHSFKERRAIRQGLGEWFRWRTHQRPHQVLAYRMIDELYPGERLANSQTIWGLSHQLVCSSSASPGCPNHGSDFI